jgi:hypothetical protein
MENNFFLHEGMWDSSVPDSNRRGMNANIASRAQQILSLVGKQTGITAPGLIELEDRVNQFWTKHNIYMILTGTHVLQRFQREEHGENPVKIDDLRRILPRFTQLYGLELVKQDPSEEHYGIIREPSTNINIGFVLRPGDGRSGYPRDIMIQTVLRTDKFRTNDRVFSIEKVSSPKHNPLKKFKRLYP